MLHRQVDSFSFVVYFWTLVVKMTVKHPVALLITL